MGVAAGAVGIVEFVAEIITIKFIRHVFSLFVFYWLIFPKPIPEQGMISRWPVLAVHQVDAVLQQNLVKHLEPWDEIPSMRAFDGAVAAYFEVILGHVAGHAFMH